MVKRCALGTCKSDERYLDPASSVFFIPFPKPKTQKEKCLRWIRACGRPHYQLNVENINKHKYVCSKHFPVAEGPTQGYPDPLPADGSTYTPTRLPPKRSQSAKRYHLPPKRKCLASLFQNETSIQRTDVGRKEDNEIMTIQSATSSVGTQTEHAWISPLDLLAQSSEISRLEQKLQEKDDIINELNSRLSDKNKKTEKQVISNNSKFGVSVILTQQKKLKGLFKYYTGLTYVRFIALLTFLLPKNSVLNYKKKRIDIRSLTNRDCLLLCLYRLRHNFGLRDLAVRFQIGLQSAGDIFNTWIDHMYWKFGQLSIWPHRDLIIKNMPVDFKKDFSFHNCHS
ncbi:uncharacterized protein [Ptychodera flava]|uniref:uncharacterized protein n=1 Tax=Ptychodera flava TaxID=63121 RepID=UPI00396A706B